MYSPDKMLAIVFPKHLFKTCIQKSHLNTNVHQSYHLDCIIFKIEFHIFLRKKDNSLKKLDIFKTIQCLRPETSYVFGEFKCYVMF